MSVNPSFTLEGPRPFPKTPASDSKSREKPETTVNPQTKGMPDATRIRSKGKEELDPLLHKGQGSLLDKLHLKHPVFGSRKLAKLLSREEWVMNRKRGMRLLQVMGVEA